MQKIIIAHNLNYKLLMHEERIFPSKLSKYYSFKDIKKIKKNELKNVEIFFGARPGIDLIKKLKNLKKVALISRGIDENLKKYLKFSKIKFFTLNKSFLKPVVATIYAFIFGLARGLDLSYENRNKKRFSKINFDRHRRRINNVYDEKFLLVGFGEVNKLLFKTLRHFTNNITIINRSKYKIKHCKFVTGLSNLKYQVKNKTFIINSLPFNNDTKNIFNKEIFKNFKKYCVFINVGRGETINFEDFKKYYDKKKMLIGFDVYEKENERELNYPIPKNFFLLKKFGNFFTPHIASYDNDIWIKYMNYLEKILHYK
jgi:phosphoglycerate dehydrogenase-like enzyme